MPHVPDLNFGERLLPALLVASAVALLAAGMVAWFDPGVGARGVGSRSIRADRSARAPTRWATAAGPAAPARPGRVVRPPGRRSTRSRAHAYGTCTERPERTARPTAGHAGAPTAAPATPAPEPTAQPTPARRRRPTAADAEAHARPADPNAHAATHAGAAEPTPQPHAAPTPAPSPEPRRAGRCHPIVIASRDIDLPIISRERRVKGQGPDKYPPCDVALYHTAFGQPGQPGTTYIYAHAREGMFLPLLDASTRRNGASLVGALVQVYTSDEREHVYQITRVKRHALDFSLALDAPPDAHQLIMQTSEGPRGTVPKLQVLAELVDVLPVTSQEANPRLERARSHLLAGHRQHVHGFGQERAAWARSPFSPCVGIGWRIEGDNSVAFDPGHLVHVLLVTGVDLDERRRRVTRHCDGSMHPATAGTCPREHGRRCRSSRSAWLLERGVIQGHVTAGIVGAWPLTRGSREMMGRSNSREAMTMRVAGGLGVAGRQRRRGRRAVGVRSARCGGGRWGWVRGLGSGVGAGVSALGWIGVGPESAGRRAAGVGGAVGSGVRVPSAGRRGRRGLGGMRPGGRPLRRLWRLSASTAPAGVGARRIGRSR